MEIPNQEKIWDKIAPSWNKFKSKPLFLATDFLKNKKGKILDLGCGSGRNFQKSKTKQFYGIDFSEKMLITAKKKNIAKELKKTLSRKIPRMFRPVEIRKCRKKIHPHL